MRPVAAMPSMTGISQSIRIRSNCSLANRSAAICPLEALTTLATQCFEHAQRHLLIHGVVFRHQDPRCVFCRLGLLLFSRGPGRDVACRAVGGDRHKRIEQFRRPYGSGRIAAAPISVEAGIANKGVQADKQNQFNRPLTRRGPHGAHEFGRARSQAFHIENSDVERSIGAAASSQCGFRFRDGVHDLSIDLPVGEVDRDDVGNWPRCRPAPGHAVCVADVGAGAVAGSPCGAALQRVVNLKQDPWPTSLSIETVPPISSTS